MGILSRFFKIGQAEVHHVLDKLEDPVKLTEQGIRDLKKNLSEATSALAEVKASMIRFQRAAENEKKRAIEYVKKAGYTCALSTNFGYINQKSNLYFLNPSA